LITRDGGDVLMQDRDLVQMPSVSVLVLERSNHKDRAVSGHKVVAISVSDRELSGAREEVRDLARRYRNVDQFTDLRDVDAFAEAAQRGDALHIASHALMVDRAPWWSGIQLRRTKSLSDSTGANHAWITRSENSPIRFCRRFVDGGCVRSVRARLADRKARYSGATGGSFRV
jgi:hypothetical protein